MIITALVLLVSLIVLAEGYPGVPSGSYLPSAGQYYESAGSSSHIGHGLSHSGLQDQKHVYFFASPDVEHNSRLRINIIPNSQRNTKIVFVKAPSYGAVVPEVIAPPSISEDRTLVYLLVKGPQHGGQINIPAGVGVTQAKPQVYFIKYKAQHEAEAAIKEGLDEKPVGTSVPDLGNEADFVKTFGVGVIQPR